MFRLRKNFVVYIMGLLLVLFLAEGCSKNVPAPALAPEPITDAVPDATPVAEEEIAERVFGEQEPGFDIGADTSFRETEFLTESGTAIEEPMMEPEPIEEVVEEVLVEVGPTFGVAESQDFGGEGLEPMQMTNEAFSAEPMEETMPPVEEAIASTPAPAPFMEAAPGPLIEEARLFRPSVETHLEDIHFSFDQFDLDESSKQALRNNANVLRDNPEMRVEIQGHCDERGTNNYNLGLGERRVLSTKKFLTALGIESHRLTTISYGEEKPFCFDNNDDCWRQNRRSHFMVLE